MADLVSLANRKLALSLEDRLRAIPGEIKAVKSEHSAKGLLRSGATLKRVRALYIAHIKAHGEAVANEYKWAIAHALLASQSWTERIASGSPAQLAPLFSGAKRDLADLATFVGRPELADGLVSDVERELGIADERIKLAVRAAFAEKSRGLVRSTPAAVMAFFSRFFRPGP